MNDSNDQEEFDLALQDIVEQTYKALRGRDAHNYDGILGLPPKWVPEWALNQFRNYRNRLIDVREYEPSNLLALVTRYRICFFEDKNPAGFQFSTTYPNGQSIDLYCFQDEIGFLAWLKYCADQGPEMGLGLIGGGFAADKFKANKALEEGRKTSAIVRKSISVNNRKKWRNAARDKFQDNPTWTNDRIAKWIQKEFNEMAAIGTIKNAIKGIKTEVLSQI